MTIEEANQLAETMISSGDYYTKQKTGKGIEAAAKWYEITEKQNDVHAIHMNVILKKV